MEPAPVRPSLTSDKKWAGPENLKCLETPQIPCGVAEFAGRNSTHVGAAMVLVRMEGLNQKSGIQKKDADIAGRRMSPNEISMLAG